MNNIKSCICVDDFKSTTDNYRSSRGVGLTLKSLVKTSSKMLTAALLLTTANVNADVTLENQVKISDIGLHFDGLKDTDSQVKVLNTQERIDDEKYHFHFGRNISAHGDAVKTYKHYVFMTWYRGGKDDRHVMLTRYNTQTGQTVDIEFPHRHTGFQGQWWIGESHNTIGLAVSPINGTIHMVYDMHAYNDDPDRHGGRMQNDFFRYSYSVAGAAEVADEDFTLAQFVTDPFDTQSNDQVANNVPKEQDYKHLTMTGDLADKNNFAALTYPKFFETADGTLLLYMRLGGNNNGAYVFNSYDADAQKWTKFTKFNHNNQKSHGNAYNWGLYGNMKYINGKLRVGFQQRSSDNNDKYYYQNGVYYAYSDHPEGFGDWKNHKDEPMTFPLVNSDEIKVYEPGDYISHTEANSVYIVGSFDWTVTAKGDIHTISLVRSRDRKRPDYEQEYIHAYKPAGAEEFIIDTDFVGASEIYTAGDNIYIIGLKNGRPFVEKAVGGTSQFERVYEETQGPVFDHGTVYVKNGKVYYYLMERTSGAAMPLHLQVIDLDIAKVSVSFEQPELTLIKDYSAVSITATPSIKDSERSIKSVALYLDDELVSTLNAAPFTWTESETKLQNLALGSYTLKALVTDDNGDTSETFMTLNVVEGTPTVEFVKSDITVVKDYTNLEINVDANTPDSARTITEVSLYLDDTLISSLDMAPYKWSNTDASLQGLAIGDYTLKAVVVDSKGETAETTMNLSVVDPTPTASFPQETYTVSDEYSSLSLSVNASTPVETRTIADVELYVNGNPIRKESVAPYEWGHNDDFKEELLNFPVGTHDLKAIVTDSEGLTFEAVADLIVQETVVAPEVNFSESSLSVEQGYNELTIDVTASTSMSTRTIKQVALFVNGTQISALTSAPYQWTASETQLAALPVGTHVLKAVATDSQDLPSETTMQIVVTAKETQPDDNDSEDDNDEQDQASGSSSGGGSTTPLFAALIVLLALRRRYLS